ncbi:hypothetical protein Bbelb_146710 [Branchiostoma belcheri]|nr:hypothetical protein Bbelb_146710 [Branchiostoma belcheri]
MDKVIDLSSRRKRVRRKVCNSAMVKSSSRKLTASTDKCAVENDGKKGTENVSSRRKGEDQADATKKDTSSEGREKIATIARRRSSLPACATESLPQIQHQKKCAKSCKLVQRRRYSLPNIQPHDNERHELTKIAEESEEEVVLTATLQRMPSVLVLDEEVETTSTTRRRMSVPVESLQGQLQRPKGSPTSSKHAHRRRHSLPAIKPPKDQNELHTVVEGEEHDLTKETEEAVQTVETMDEAMKKASALLRERLFPSIVTPVLDVNNSSAQPTEKIQLPPKLESEGALDSDLDKKSLLKTSHRRATVVCIDGTAVTGSHAEHFHRRRSFPTLCAEHCKPRLGPELRTGDMGSWLGTKSKARIYSMSVDGGYIIKASLGPGSIRPTIH